MARARRPQPHPDGGWVRAGAPAFRSPVNDSDRESHGPRAQHPRERGRRPASASDARPLSPASGARSPPGVRRSTARTTVAGRRGGRARSGGEGLAPGPRSPPLGDTLPPKRHSSPRGGLGVVPTEVASGEAPRVPPPRIPSAGQNGTARWGGAPGQPLAAGDRLLRRVVVAKRGRGGGDACAPSFPGIGPEARRRAGAGHAGPDERAGVPSIAVAASLFAPSSPLEGSGWRKTREAGS